jgi:hypothetical protein
MSSLQKDVDKDEQEFERALPKYMQRSKMDKMLKGHIATMIVLCFVFTDVVAVAGETMISSVCRYKDPRTDYAGWTDHIDHTEDALSALSLTMLCLLLGYQVVLLIGLGYKEYFADYNGPLDFIIILLSIIFDLTIPEEGVAFIAIALLWRCVRVFHGLYCEIEEFSDSEEMSQRIIEKLRGTLKAHNIPIPKMKDI